MCCIFWSAPPCLWGLVYWIVVQNLLTWSKDAFLATLLMVFLLAQALSIFLSSHGFMVLVFSLFLSHFLGSFWISKNYFTPQMAVFHERIYKPICQRTKYQKTGNTASWLIMDWDNLQIPRMILSLLFTIISIPILVYFLIYLWIRFAMVYRITTFLWALLSQNPLFLHANLEKLQHFKVSSLYEWDL